jgi:hypothetical protein
VRTPQVAVELDISKLPEKIALLAVISPLANIILAGTSPTEKPATEFNDLIAILFSYIHIYLF